MYLMNTNINYGLFGVKDMSLYCHHFPPAVGMLIVTESAHVEDQRVYGKICTLGSIFP